MTLHPSITDPDSLTRTRLTVDRDDSWPPEPTVVTHVVAGELAERVRRRMGAPEGAEVRLTEETIYGGYSEWTQENSTTFTVSVDGQKVTFHPDGAEVDWVQARDATYDSVFARFDAWLSAAEHAAALFAEWFELEAESGQVVRYRSRPDTILDRVARRHSFKSDHLSLTGKGDGHGREWGLDVVSPADSDGFSAVLERMTLCYSVGMVISDDVAREVLFEVTDYLMFGRER